jgi:hypothetical protein
VVKYRVIHERGTSEFLFCPKPTIPIAVTTKSNGVISFKLEIKVR